MYFDFRALYDYLVDTDSHGSMSERLPSGGICVLQNLQAFDDRHKYSPLPHPLPLLPNASAHAKAQSQRVFLARLGSKNARNDRQSTARSALHAATNTKDLSNVNAPLVKAYRQFEREECAARKEEKCSLGDARKTRWILVYTTFQMLISVNRAPKEVRATEHATYPLCVMVAGLPPWDVQVPPPGLNTPASPVEDRPTTAIAVNSGASIDQNGMPNLHKALPKPPALEIHPDCENDAEYLSGSRNNSSSSLTNLTTINEPQTPPKTTLPSPIRRNSSKRSVKGLSFSSLVSRRNSVVEKPQQPSFCEIIIHGYGNGLNPIIVDKSASDDQPQPMEEFIGLGPPKANPVESDTTPTPVFARSNSCFTITTVNATDRHPSLPSQAQRPRVRSKKKPEQLTNLHVKAAPDPIRTPTLDIEQIDTMKDMIPDSEDMSMSTITGTDSDTDDVSPVWSSRRGSASSQSSADNEDKAMEVGLLDEHDDVSKLMTQSTPELIDVGGLLKGSNPAGKRPQGILVHRSFSVERFNAPLAGTGGNVIPPNVLAARKERDKAFAAAQGKWKRKSVRYKEQVDMITALDTGPVGAAP